MKLNQFAVYRVDQQTAGKALWHLPYQEARQQNVSITVENYRLISIHEMQENEKVADIWKRTKNQCEVSDVLVLNKNGEISCYYVDENYPQYLAGFIRINTSGALITMEREIDFVVNSGGKRTYIQSAYAMPTDEKAEVELRPFTLTGDSFPKIVVRKDIGKRWYDDNGILNINVIDFLLDKELI